MPGAHQKPSTPPSRPDSDWGTARWKQDQSPTYTGQVPNSNPDHYGQSQAGPPSVPGRRSSLKRRSQRVTPPSVEEDYDNFRTSLTASANAPPRNGGGALNDSRVGKELPSPPTAQSSGGHGRNHPQADMDQGLGLQDLSISDSRPATAKSAMSPTGSISPISPTSSTRRKPLALPRTTNVPYAEYERSIKPLPVPRDSNVTTAHHHGRVDPDGLASRDNGSQSDLYEDAREQQLAASTSEKSAAEHLPRLPPGFNMTNSEDTTVHTTHALPVTHEVKHHKTTEIIQEAITRDIHVDHYYHYVQPVKVVEVLPAKHFRLDKRTGEKISIAPPKDWEMTHDLTERTVDTSGVKGSRRDYLVDDENPTGRLLNEAELKEEKSKGHLLDSAQMGGTSANRRSLK